MNKPEIKISTLLFLILAAVSLLPVSAQDYISTRDQFPRPDFPFFYRDINLLRKNLSQDQVNSIIQPSDKWKPYPKAGDRSAWEQLSPRLKQKFIQLAEKYNNFEWPALKATDFMEYAQNGNRSRYQARSFQRTEILYYLVIAECIEHKGRFMNTIVNGIWAICEESFWGVPAHLFLQKEGSTVLPIKSEPVCDLFSAERAACLAWTYYLLENELDKVTPMIGQRIYDEVNQRIFIATMVNSDWRWQGLKTDMTRRVNNWDPWISSNWLACILILEKDPQRRARYLYRLLEILDQFINTQPEDGSCEEGPSYWARASASLFECLEMLYSASNGKVNLFTVPLVKNSGSYIYKVNIGNRFFFNYADADPKTPKPPANLIYRYGRLVGDSKLQQYGTWLMKEQNPDTAILETSFLRGLPDLFNLPDYKSQTAKEPLPRDVWFPSNQLMCARSQEDSPKGLFLAIKGNDNMESHNHNDVGNFIIYVDGFPAIIDVGRRQYTGPSDTNSLRDIYKTSAYHNLPLVNGVQQANGRVFRATDVKYKYNDAEARIEMNIAKAYPEQAGIQSWTRSLDFQRDRQIRLTESFDLSQDKNHIELMLMTPRKPAINSAGSITLNDATELSAALVIRYDPKIVQPKIETLPCDDDLLRNNWGANIYRLVFHYIKDKKKDTITMTFSKQ